MKDKRIAVTGTSIPLQPGAQTGPTPFPLILQLSSWGSTVGSGLSLRSRMDYNLQPRPKHAFVNIGVVGVPINRARTPS